MKGKLPTRRIRRGFWALSALVVVALACFLNWRHRLGRFDLVVCGCRVFDGGQWRGPGTCLGVRDGRVQKLGFLYGADTKRWIYGSGKVLAPGFIDVHAHVERNITERRPFRAPNFVRMGVTTVVTGNCGTSRLDVGRLLEGIDRFGSQVNLATFVGHNSVREEVMGNALRAADKEQIAAMCRLIERNVREGALGLSTGLAYAPGSYSDETEIVELARVTARAGGIYNTHLRDEGIDGAEALEEALRIGSAADIPVHVSHFKVASSAEWGSSTGRLARIDQARQRGQKVTLDAYAYTASSTSLDILLPPNLRGNYQLLRSLRKDPQHRAAVIAGMLSQLRRDGFHDYSYARIAYFHRDRSLEGLSIPQAADKIEGKHGNGSAPLQKQAEAVLNLLARGGAQMVYFSMSEEDVKAILRHPSCSIGTDSSVRTGEPRFVHPRGIGNFPRVLGHYVRDEKVLRLEDALRKMTSIAADTFGLDKRGRLAEGFPADFVIFDAKTVRDNATYEAPLEPPTGVPYVFVNGVAAVEDGAVTKLNGGKAVRNGGKIER